MGTALAVGQHHIAAPLPASIWQADLEAGRGIVLCAPVRQALRLDNMQQCAAIQDRGACAPGQDDRGQCQQGEPTQVSAHFGRSHLMPRNACSEQAPLSSARKSAPLRAGLPQRLLLIDVTGQRRGALNLLMFVEVLAGDILYRMGERQMKCSGRAALLIDDVR